MSDTLLSLYEALQTPARAQIVSNHGELALLTVSHPHDDSVAIERFPLGPMVDVATLLQLLDSLGLLPHETVRQLASAPIVATKTAPATTGPLICPECGRAWKSVGALGVHRRKKHGVAGKNATVPVSPPPTAPAPAPPKAASSRVDICDLCGLPWKGHLRCDDCATLIGQGHTVTEPAIVDGRHPFCEPCARRRKLIGNGHIRENAPKAVQA